MDEFNLKIESTQSPSKFKAAQSIEKLDIKENPKKKGSYFMTDEAGNAVGGVSPALVAATLAGEQVTPVVSWVTPLDPETKQPSAEPFFLLHRKGEGAQTVFSL